MNAANDAEGNNLIQSGLKRIQKSIDDLAAAGQFKRDERAALIDIAEAATRVDRLNHRRQLSDQEYKICVGLNDALAKWSRLKNESVNPARYSVGDRVLADTEDGWLPAIVVAVIAGEQMKQAKAVKQPLSVDDELFVIAFDQERHVGTKDEWACDVFCQRWLKPMGE